MSEPKCVEITATVSLSGKVQIVRYENDQGYFFSLGGKWMVPEDWTDEQVEQFRLEKLAELRVELEAPAQDEIDNMMELRDNA